MEKSNSTAPRRKRPEWLKVKAPGGEGFAKVKSLMRSKSLHTVCEEAHCPNINECWNCGAATFMILGEICSRNCRFCAVKTGSPQAPDPDEPANVADSVRGMKLKHAVITSVTRDDLPDGGAAHWAEVVRQTKLVNPNTTVEVLIPDFVGDKALLDIVLDAKPDVLNHNIETVPRLYKEVRPQAKYEVSLEVLKYAKSRGFRTKSGMMLGLGERREEIDSAMKDLRDAGVDILTLGQYLRPTKKHLPVAEYVKPGIFAELKEEGLRLGFMFVESAPLVRSSYHAEKHA